MNCLNVESIHIEVKDAQDDPVLAIEKKHEEACRLLQW
jgi:hypothetical protein